LRQEQVRQRQRQVTVGHRGTERALGSGSFGVDVDPLVVTGRLGERVHLLLGDRHPVAVPEMSTDCGTDLVDALEDGHGHAILRLGWGARSPEGGPGLECDQRFSRTELPWPKRPWLTVIPVLASAT